MASKSPDIVLLQTLAGTDGALADSARRILETLGESQTPPVTRKPASKTRKSPKATAARKPRKATSTAQGCITAGEAWIALGSDPTFEPKDHSKPANNAQLYRLNAQGLVSLAQ